MDKNVIGRYAEVAPFAGAWIETFLAVARLSYTSCVAPFAGAWIETLEHVSILSVDRLSPPSRGRGLKLHVAQAAACCLVVALFSDLAADFAKDPDTSDSSPGALKREELELVCFEYVSS